MKLRSNTILLLFGVGAAVIGGLAYLFYTKYSQLNTRIERYEQELTGIFGIIRNLNESVKNIFKPQLAKEDNELDNDLDNLVQEESIEKAIEKDTKQIQVTEQKPTKYIIKQNHFKDFLINDINEEEEDNKTDDFSNEEVEEQEITDENEEIEEDDDEIEKEESKEEPEDNEEEPEEPEEIEDEEEEIEEEDEEEIEEEEVETKIEKAKNVLEEMKKKKTCSHILKTGKRKGEECGKDLYKENLCKNHYKK